MVKTLNLEEKGEQETTGRKSFSPEIRAKAVQLLNDGWTLKDTANEIGCSVPALQLWKKAAGGGKATKKTAKKASRKRAAKTADAETGAEETTAPKRVKKASKKGVKRAKVKRAKRAAHASNNGESFSDFVQEYLDDNAKETVSTQEVKGVLDVLFYAYNKVTKK
jgi:transposase-like protein